MQMATSLSLRPVLADMKILMQGCSRRGQRRVDTGHQYIIGSDSITLVRAVTRPLVDLTSTS